MNLLSLVILDFFTHAYHFLNICCKWKWLFFELQFMWVSLSRQIAFFWYYMAFNTLHCIIFHILIRYIGSIIKNFTFWYSIWNYQPKEGDITNVYLNLSFPVLIFDFNPPYWIWGFEFYSFNFTFGISDPITLRASSLLCTTNIHFNTTTTGI